MSNDNDAVELYPSYPEVSADDDDADGSAGIFSLNVGGDQWREDDALNSLDPRLHLAQLVQNPLFTLPSSFQHVKERHFVAYVDLFFHKQLFSTMVVKFKTKLRMLQR